MVHALEYYILLAVLRANTRGRSYKLELRYATREVLLATLGRAPSYPHLPYEMTNGQTNGQTNICIIII